MDDFCVTHGYEFMKYQLGNPIPHCAECDAAKIGENEMSEVLSGCAVRAVIQQERASALPDEERHYLSAILIRLNTLYELTEEPSIREQLQDEVGWLEERLGVAE